MANTNKKQERNEGKDNVILLTVIALATMIVVVVGATFAYLANSVTEFDSSNISASTNGTADIFMIDAGGDISVYADNNNFGERVELDNGTTLLNPNVSDNTVATVTFKRATEEEATYKYNVYLNVVANNFEYSSGACYNVTALSPVEIDGYENCVATTGNVWATSDGSTYACYNANDLYSALYAGGSTTYSNELSCVGQPNATWGSTHTPELVMELYEAKTVTGECTAQGVCLNGNYDIVDGVTSQSTCENTLSNTWIANKSQDGFCYSVVAAKDLTEVQAGQISLLQNKEITTGLTPVTHNYLAEVTLKNFTHNQMINASKEFKAELTFAKVVESE